MTSLSFLQVGGAYEVTSKTTLRLKNETLNAYKVTFNWSFSDYGGGILSGGKTATIYTDLGFLAVGDQQFGGMYTTDGMNIIYTSIAASAYLPSGATLEFTTTTDNTSPRPVLTINSFNAEAVPAPLPAAGAASAFGCSRRLRRRIKGKRPSGSRPPVVLPHPSAYLNLTPKTLKSLPVSFSYNLRPSAPTTASGPPDSAPEQGPVAERRPPWAAPAGRFLG